MSISRRSQVWYLDFILSFFIFSIVVTIFLHFVVNKDEQAKIEQDQLLIEARIVSNALMLPGFPLDWQDNPAFVERVGLTNGDSNLNRSKMLALRKVSYSNAKKLFDVRNGFFVYFEDDQKRSVPIYGVCSFGEPRLMMNRTRWIAYARGDAKGPFEPAIQALNASLAPPDEVHVFCEGGNAAGCRDTLVALGSGIWTFYDLFIVDNVSTVPPDNLLTNLITKTRSGYPIVLVGNFTSNSAYAPFGGGTLDNSIIEGRNITISSRASIVDVPVGTMLALNRSYTFESDLSSDFKVYASAEDGTPVFMSWNVSNGTAYFLASSEVSDPVFLEELGKGLVELASPDCMPLNLTVLPYKDIVRISRLLIRQNRAATMIILTWK